jgi:Holliday junction resolvase RusA-like endonuclease
MISFVVEGELPDMNTIIKESKAHYHAYNNIKRTYTDLVRYSAPRATVEGLSNFKITWYCKNRKKDKDNIMAGQKFIFDGLKEAGVIKDDTWQYIGNIYHLFEIDKKNPRVLIEIIPSIH